MKVLYIISTLTLINLSLVNADEDACEPNGSTCNLDWTTDCCSGYCYSVFGWEKGYCADQEGSSSRTITTQRPKTKSNQKTNSKQNQENSFNAVGEFVHPKNVKALKNAANEIPFQVTLSSNEKFPVSFCGGLLINKNTVLSASHCLVDLDVVEDVPKNASTIVARVGIEQTNDQRTDLNTYPISKIYLHPNYRKVDPIQRFDIAVIKLAKNVKFNSNVKAACLSFDDGVDDYLVGSGYGVLEGRIYVDVETNKPMTKNIDLFTRPLKYSYLKETRNNEDCKTEFVCTDLYSEKSVRIMCFGSSGSPIMRSDKSVIGVKSVAVRPKGSLLTCLGPEKFSRLKYHKKFIESKLDHKNDYCESVLECDA